MKAAAIPKSSARRHVLLATLGAARFDALASALGGRGADVSILSQRERPPGQGAAPDPLMARVHQARWDAASRATTLRSVQDLLRESGAPSQLVVQALPAAALAGLAVADHDENAWHAASGAAALQVVHLLQALAPELIAQRASIVFVGPSLALVGAERLTALVTLLESLRGLMKSLARQWGAHGITCNWIALEASELWPGFGDYKLPGRLEAVPVALGRRPDAGADLAGVLDFLAGPAGRNVTGATLCLDGGEWLTP